MKIREKYKLNKIKKVGESCICPSCGIEFTKTNYQQAFCKSKVGTKCKDKYWNTVTPTKRNNTTRISPANASYYEKHILPRKMGDPDFSGAWDDHDCYVERCEYCGYDNCRCLH